ncbi:hypothetical protein Ctha_0011 [Chloroherpeton thalassium ATCC 35110]|uniref:DUF2007 domain-containing protein n=1 Tax=Chloroherpeton thalassium (strain ATCC 35110 / GB-78) TaxID=517418 RepID=B3QS92_CHLT3|nr:DUF2007 domain-containing protein [Chloroherpeton thalassium]ACF12483.1 hypothetical protein Ctha_0011 [Chloroherpeton thalassium ATCC 35110]
MPHSSNLEEIEGWRVVYNTNSEMEAELIKAYLSDAEIEAQVMSQRDHMLPANEFETLLVHVLVEPENLDAAQSLIQAFFENRDSASQESGETNS